MKEKYLRIHSDTNLQVLIDWLSKNIIFLLYDLNFMLNSNKSILVFSNQFFISENYYYTNIVSLIRLVVLLSINDPINLILPTWVTTSFYRVLPICQNILPFGSDYHIKNGKHFSDFTPPCQGILWRGRYSWTSTHCFSTISCIWKVSFIQTSFVMIFISLISIENNS